MALTGVFHVGDVLLIEPRDVDGSPVERRRGIGKHGATVPSVRAKFGPYGVLLCVATDKDDPTTDPRFRRVLSRRFRMVT
jgi:hypothetical protein